MIKALNKKLLWFIPNFFKRKYSKTSQNKIVVTSIFMCSQILSLTGKNNENRKLGNHWYKKWDKKHKIKIAKIPTVFIFFNDIIITPVLIYYMHNLQKYVKKNKTNVLKNATNLLFLKLFCEKKRKLTKNLEY